MPASDDQIDLRGYLAIVRRRKVWVLGTALVVVAVALVFSLLQTPQYRSTAEVQINAGGREEVFTGIKPTFSKEQSDNLVAGELAFMDSQRVRNAVAKRLGYVPDVSVERRGSTLVMYVASTDPEPEKAAREAGAYAQAYVDTVTSGRGDQLRGTRDEVAKSLSDVEADLEEVSRPIVALQEDIAAATSIPEQQRLQRELIDVTTRLSGEVDPLRARAGRLRIDLDNLNNAIDDTSFGGPEIISPATPSNNQSSPLVGRNVGVALLLGLVLGLVAAFLKDYFDDSITTHDDLEAAAGRLPPLALVPDAEGWRDRATAMVVSMEKPNAVASEAYRSLRTSLQFIGLDRPLGLVQLTSSEPGEGKTTTVANLGVQLARTGLRVVIVDCDLRKPRLHKFFDVGNEVGFTSVLLGQLSPAEAMMAVGSEPNLVILPSGPIPPNPSELLSSERAAKVLRDITEQADVVLVDSPPVLPVSDPLVLAGLVDAVVLVVRSGRARRRNVHHAVEQLRQINAPLIGAVLNSVGDDARYEMVAYGYGYKDAGSDRRRTGRRFRRGAAADPEVAPASGVMG